MGLSEDAKAAHDLGLTYGQYMQRKFSPDSKPNVGGMRCLECGKELPEGHRSFCSIKCLRARQSKRARAGGFI